MHIEPLSVDNLREGILCAATGPDGRESKDRLEVWLEGNQLRGLVARNDSNEVTGFVLYYPIERAPLDPENEGLYMVQCLYVKPEYHSSGVGRLLIEGAVADARTTGASGVTVDGFRRRTPGPDFMPGAFFRHMVSTGPESRDEGTLYYFTPNEHASAAQGVGRKPKSSSEPPRVKIDILDCRRCYLGISSRSVIDVVLESANTAIEPQVPDQHTREAVVDKDMSSGVFLDGRLTFFGGPITEDDVWNAIDVADNARERSMDR